MTTYRITLRCLKPDHPDIYRDYRIEAWTREDAIRKAKHLAVLQGFGSTEVSYCTPSFVSEISR